MILFPALFPTGAHLYLRSLFQIPSASSPVSSASFHILYVLECAQHSNSDIHRLSRLVKSASETAARLEGCLHYFCQLAGSSSLLVYEEHCLILERVFDRTFSLAFKIFLSRLIRSSLSALFAPSHWSLAKTMSSRSTFLSLRTSIMPKVTALFFTASHGLP